MTSQYFCKIIIANCNSIKSDVHDVKCSYKWTKIMAVRVFGKSLWRKRNKRLQDEELEENEENKENESKTRKRI